MDNKYKVVQDSGCNTDQYLCGFFDNLEEAYLSIPSIAERWRSGTKEFHVKMVDPEWINSPVATDYAHYIRSLIPDEDWNRLMKSDASAEIDANNNVCGYGGGTYYYLSRMIPLEWTVVDVGAAYGCQSALFTKHKRYIAVDPPLNYSEFHFERYQAEGTEFYAMTGGMFIREVLPTLGLDMEQTFAICNFVPEWFGENPMELVKANFKNVFTFYP